VTATSTVYSLGNHTNISPNAIATRAGTGGGGSTTQYTLTTSKTGEGTGTVTSNPSGISCGSTCNYDFDDDTEVTLTAEATAGSTFTAWSGEGCSGTGTCVVTLSEAREVAANFDVAGPQVGYVNPNADVGTPEWSMIAAPHWNKINKVTLQPDLPDTGTDISDLTTATHIDVFDMTTIASVAEVTNVKIWVYGLKNSWNADFIQGSVYMGGEWKSTSSFGFVRYTPSWQSLSFDGTWTQSDLDAMQVKLISTGSNGMDNHIYSMYVEVTYTQ